MVDLSGRAKSLTPGETIPMMRGGTPVASYECDRCRAVLAQNPRSLNPALKYLYALLVYPPEYNKPPFMFVVAEQADLSGPAASAMPPELRKLAQQHLGSEPFLCVFTDKGKYNLGSMPELGSLEGFETRALEVMREALQISGPIKILNDTRKGGSFPADKSTGCLVLCALPLVGYGVVEIVKAIVA